MVASPVENVLMHFGDEQNSGETFVSSNLETTLKCRSNVLNASPDSFKLCWADNEMEDDFTDDAIKRDSSSSGLSTGTRDFWPEDSQVLSYYGLNSTALANFVKVNIPAIVIPPSTVTNTKAAPSSVVPKHTKCDKNDPSTPRSLLLLDAVVPSAGTSPVSSTNLKMPISLDAVVPSAGTSPVSSTNLKLSPSFSIFDGLAARASFNGSPVVRAEPNAVNYDDSTNAIYWYNWC